MKSKAMQDAAAADFAKRWAGRGYEKGESQRFWLDLLGNVLRVDRPTEFVEFEDQVHLDTTSFIDAMIPSTRVMIEQKSLGHDLRKPIRQSDGTMLTPFQQAKRYITGLPLSRHPKWIVTCNFAEFDIYDMERPNGEPQRILLKDLPAEYYRLRFLVDAADAHIQKEEEVSIRAGELVGRIYDALVGQYDMSDPHSARYLNILCVRLVFCLYAEDAGIFGRRDMFHDYMAQFDAISMRAELLRLFQILDTPPQERDPYTRPDLLAFPYTNGGLFREKINIPLFNDHIRYTLLQRASLDFDWSEISPTIFGGVFESTLNPDTRRHGGMHYTSVQNIHRVIDPLFLNGLRAEFARIQAMPQLKPRLRSLHAFQDRLAALTFFDPACGSGNFLTETYLSLRRLENEVIQAIYTHETLDAFTDPVKVSIHQFYGIEINDFAVSVANTALWISEAQMLQETERIIRRDLPFLPLHNYANIREGNALRIDWEDVCPAPDYIISNPPFVGARLMSSPQKDDMLCVFGRQWKNLGNIDYVGAWYKKAVDMMQGIPIQAALVSTNSITQGEQVANLWAPLMEKGVEINFAHRTFRWDSEASLKAHVHCVIIGFSCSAVFARPQKIIFDHDTAIPAAHINPYLIDAPDVFIYSRPAALCDVPQMGIGNKPIDGGNYLFTREEMEAFVKKEPKAAPYFHPWYGAEEFIHRRPRYCLWLGDCSPHEINSMPLCKQRVENVRHLRLESKSADTRKLADRPTRFHVENMPDGDSIIIPRVSSEKREYIPMGYTPAGTFASDAVHLIPSATLYHFGVLESSVHMAWTRAVCGRLEMRYRYSKDIVYNNFPWPECNNVGAGRSKAVFARPQDAITNGRTEASASTGLVQRIAQTAQAILNARALYPDSSLADLYDPATMPAELRRAHRQNDRAVLQAYGFPPAITEPEIVARLFRLYRQLVEQKRKK